MSNTVKTVLVFSKDTKNTHVFKNEEPNAPIPSLYIKKGSFETTPSKITVTVE